MIQVLRKIYTSITIPYLNTVYQKVIKVQVILKFLITTLQSLVSRNVTVYSCRSASIGLSFAAFLAG